MKINTSNRSSTTLPEVSTEDELSTLDRRAKSKDKQDDADHDDDDRGSRLSCCGKFRFFVKMSCKDICRHPCQFCLSFCSVFTVVLSILLVISITEKGPFIFLSIGESHIGQYDGIIAPTSVGKVQEMDDYQLG